MSENLTSFLIDLACDRARMASFAANPVGELERSPLSAEERAAILAGEAARLRSLLAGSNGGDGIMDGFKKGGTKKGGATKGTKKTATKTGKNKKKTGSGKK